jgi:hypothetical protein
VWKRPAPGKGASTLAAGKWRVLLESRHITSIEQKRDKDLGFSRYFLGFIPGLFALIWVLGFLSH